MGARWYGEGLRFACRRSGNCCSGRGSVVRVSRREIEALARATGMPPGEFERLHTREAHEDRVLRDSGDAGDCEWLVREEDGTTRCRVQEAKPDQCRSYPFWPRTLRSRESWTAEGRRCHGIGSGDVVPAAEIDRRTGLEDALADLELLLDELDYEVADLGAVCEVSGNCCDFPAAGHRLYASAPEALRFAGGVDLVAWDPASGLCPAWRDRRCTAREHRPVACRVYFCDPGKQDEVQDLGERYATRLKWLHDKHGLAWEYRDLLAHLADLREETLPGAVVDRCDPPRNDP